MSSRRGSLGLSLIEVVVFIIVLGVGFSGILILYNQTTRASVDPVVRKQAVAIATSLMEEIQLRGFTYCDPDDPNVYAAADTTGCTSAAHVDNIGPDTTPPSTTAETRNASPADPRFDHVNDYHGLAMANSSGPNPIQDATGTTLQGLDGYSVQVAVETADGDLPNVNAGDTLRITVTVTAPAGVTINQQGYRLPYAPNTP